MNLIDFLVNGANRWGAGLVQFAWPMLVQSSFVMGILLALNWLTAQHVRAAVRYWLLLLVLLKLVLPPSLALPTGLGSWFHNAPAQREVLSLRPFLGDAGPALTQTAPPPHRPRLSWPAVFGLLWFLGFAALSLRLLQRTRALKRLLVRASPPSGPLQQMLHSCREQMGIKRSIRLLSSNSISTPALCGLLSPAIVLPQCALDRLSAQQLRSALLHELTHLRRKDLEVNCAQALLQVIYWFHPLLWWSNAVLRRVREQAVDETVMVAMRDQPAVYPAALLAVAKLGSERPRFGFGTLGIMESKAAFKQRLVRLTSRPIPRTSKLGCAGAISTVCLAAILLPLAHSRPAEPNTPPPQTLPKPAPDNGSSSGSGSPAADSIPGPLSGTNVVEKIVIRHAGPQISRDVRVLAQIKLKAGDLADRTAIEADVRALYATGWFNRLTVEETTGTKGIIATYIVEDRLRLRDIQFKGNTLFTELKLRQTISSEAGGLVDERELYNDAQAIQELYRRIGEKNTEVRYHLAADERAGDARVTFEVTGPSSEFTQLKFSDGSVLTATKRNGSVLEGVIYLRKGQKGSITIHAEKATLDKAPNGAWVIGFDKPFFTREDDGARLATDSLSFLQEP